MNTKCKNQDSFLVIIDYSEYLRKLIDKIISERHGNRVICELFIRWIIEHKLFGRRLPSELKHAAEFMGEIRLPADVEVSKINLIEVKIKRNSCYLYFSTVSGRSKDRVDGDGIERILLLDNLTNIKKYIKDLQFLPVTYLISIKGNSEFYVGSSGNAYKRVKEHINDLKSNRHPAKILSSEFEKVGRKIESLSVLIFFARDSLSIVSKEQEFFDYVRLRATLLNNSIFAYSPGKGIKRDPSSIEKMRISQRNKLMSVATREMMSKSRKGKINYSIEVRKKQDEKRKKKIMGDGVLYSCAKEAARVLKIHPSSINRRIPNDNYPTWYYVNSKEDPNINLNEKVVIRNKLNENKSYTLKIEGIIYRRTKEAAKRFNISPHTVLRRCSADPKYYPQWKEWEFV